LRLIVALTVALVCLLQGCANPQARLLQGCANPQARLPAVTDTPAGFRQPGKIIWHDLVTHTPEASKRFYRELFGWEFENLGLDFGFGRTVNYSLIRHQGELIGGLVDANLLGRSNPQELSQWLVAMSVENVDAAVRACLQNGGKVLTPPTDFAERGTIALIEDDQGAVLILLQTRDGDPADTSVPVGSFLWDEIWTEDLDRAEAFYGQLANLSADNFVMANGSGYRYMFSAGSEATPRFGLLKTPIEGLSPTWTTYIRVEQPESVVAQVAALGGKVIVPLQQRGEVEQVALLADPSGAGFAIQTWSGQSSVASARAHAMRD
jgi:uncharacterized protein